MKNALVVLEKEWLELRLQPTLLLATLILPPLITAFAVAAFFVVGKISSGMSLPSTPLPPEVAGLSLLELGQAIVGKQFSTLFLL
ncbi:MAG TPA: ABC transporter permease, partial [Candidatus Limnocylindria bacterium]